MSIKRSYFDLEPIKNIDEFLNQIEELNKIDKWIYRGHRESSWELIPGTGRYPNKSYDEVLKIWVYKRPNYTLMNYAKIVEFKKQAHNELNEKLKNFSKEQKKWFERIIAQHHRLPTRLLDFTTDPFVALFFAVNKKSPEQSDSNCVWCIKNNIFPTYDLNKIEDFNKLSKINPDQPDLLRINPIKIIPRVTAQKSIFICFDDKYTDLRRRYRIITRNDIYRIKILKQYRKKVLEELDEKGINSQSLLLTKNELDKISNKIIEYFENKSK